MKRIPAIKAVMTPFPYSIEADATLAEARRRMAAHDFQHLPVTEGGRLVGVVAARELGLALDPRLCGPSQDVLRVRDLCRRDPYVVEMDEPLDNVLVHMAAHHLDAALVVRQGKLVGIFTTTDACQRFGELMREQFLPPGGDEAA